MAVRVLHDVWEAHGLEGHLMELIYEYIDAKTGQTRHIRALPRCPDCGSMHCPNGGMETLMACPGSYRRQAARKERDERR